MFRSVLLKILIFIIIAYAVLVTTSLAITGYIFFNTTSCIKQLEHVVKEKTGYNLNIQAMHAKLSHNYLPELDITGIDINDAKDAQIHFHLQQLNLILSYKSLWYLQPIFQKIVLSGTQCDLIYHKDGSITLNGLSIYPSHTTNNNTEFERYLLRQTQINLAHLVVRFTDNKHSFVKKIILPELNLTLNNHYDRHQLLLAFINSSNIPMVSRLDFIGNTLSNPDTWQSATLLINAATAKDTSLLLKALIQQGRLQSLHADLNVLNLLSANLIANIAFNPQFSGMIDIKAVDNNNYKLSASNLSITIESHQRPGHKYQGSEKYNNAISQQTIIGHYNSLLANGDLVINNTDLSSFDRIIQLLPQHNHFRLSGILSITKFSWHRLISTPHGFNLLMKFNNLALNSQEDIIPSINNLDGELLVNSESGSLNLHFKNSTFSYLKFFRIPFNIIKFDPQISWSIKQESANVILSPTLLSTPDFIAKIQANYNYHPVQSESHLLGYLHLTAHIDTMKINKVAHYLPLVIGTSAHTWLDNGLVGGTAHNANFIFAGELSNFPFKHNDGIFQLDVDATNAKVNYINHWPMLTDLVGTFQLRNEKLIVTANSGMVAHTKITQAQVMIPDIVAPQLHITVDGKVNGQTSDFMHYLSQTPLDKLIGYLPDKVTTAGSGSLKLKLDVPLVNPFATKVDGVYTLNNNQLMFNHLPVPVISDATGGVAFSEHGVSIKHLTANILHAAASLNASTDKFGIMQFNAVASNLDYALLTQYYLPFLTPVMHGTATTNLNLTIGKNGIQSITTDSNLANVAIDVPTPLNKVIDNHNALFQLTLTPVTANQGYNINFAYSNQNNHTPICTNTAAIVNDTAQALCGNVRLNAQGGLSHAEIQVGTLANLSTMADENRPIILVSVNVPTIDTLPWVRAITKLVKHSVTVNTLNNSNSISKNTAINSKIATKLSTIFPLEVWINTKHLWLDNINFLRANADVLVLPNQMVFNLNNTLTDGYGCFTFNTHTLDIYLNRLNIQKTINTVNHSQAKHATSQATATKLPQTEELITTPIDLTQAELAKLRIVDTPDESISYSESTNKQDATTLDFPTVNFGVGDFNYEHAKLAVGHIHIKPVGHDLLIESSNFTGNTTLTTFYGANYCMDCAMNKAYVKLHINLAINDLGLLLEHLNFGKVIAGGSGNVNFILNWPGTLQDMQFTNLIAKITIDLHKGRFLKIDTGGIFGQILGILNLQSITNLATLNFNAAFASGFYFDKLKLYAYLVNNRLQIKSMHMNGPLAKVFSYGIIDIKDDRINMYLTITPQIGTGVAVGAGIIGTPILGVIVYAGEWLLGQPINKLFNFSYHITGTLEKPVMSKIDISHQVLENLASIISSDK